MATFTTAISALIMTMKAAALASSTQDAPSFSSPTRTLFDPGLTLEYPAAISLRAGVLEAPPFAMIHATNGSNVYSGFEIDMLDQLRQLANEDGVDLTFELSPSPPQYGDAFDLVANDCNTTANPNPKEECERFDMIVAGYYVNPTRALRAKFTPSWLRTSMSTIARAGEDAVRLDTAKATGAPVCLPEGTWLLDAGLEKFAGLAHVGCPSQPECLEALRDGRCELYVDDELELRYRAALDPRVAVTAEQFNYQYFVWPMKYGLDPVTRLLVEKWIFAAVASGSLDALYEKYFTAVLCPAGTAGENCEFNCDPKYGYSDPASRQCVCHSLKRTGDSCSEEVPEELNLYPTWQVAMCYVYFAINASACILCATWMHWKRKKAQVDVWQPSFLRLVLLGCLLSSSSILASAQESAGDGPVPACAVFPWLYCVGLSVTYGTLFAKILRVYRLFRAAASTRRIAVTVKDTLKIVGAITSVDIAICTVWTAVDRLRWTREVASADQYGDPLSSVGYCTSDHWKVFVFVIAAWHLILMLVACYLCYVSRNVPSEFSAGQMLSIAMFSNLQITMIGIPVLILIGAEEPSVQLFVRSTLIWLNDFAVIALIFGRLIHSVHTYPEESVNIGTAVQTFTRRQSLKIKKDCDHPEVGDTDPQNAGHIKEDESVNIQKAVRAFNKQQTRQDIPHIKEQGNHTEIGDTDPSIHAIQHEQLHTSKH